MGHDLRAPPLTLRTADVNLPPSGLAGLAGGLRPSAAWIRQGHGLLGLGEALRVSASGPRRFQQLDAAWRQITAEQSDLTGFVSVSFSAASEYESLLTVPAVLLRSDESGARLQVVEETGKDLRTMLAEHGLVLEDGALRLAAPELPQVPPAALGPGTQTPAQYLSAVAAGLSAIDSGTVEKLVLARDVVVSADAALPAGPLLARLAADYPQTWTYRVGQMIRATPEMLMQLRGERLFSRVLAGTVDHDAPAESLLTDHKQHREHDLAVASLMDQLAP